MIRIGTMIRANGGKAPRRLEAVAGRGFESYQFHWWATLDGEDPVITLRTCRQILDTADVPFSVGLYGNPLIPGAVGEATVGSIRTLIRAAHQFEIPFIGLFTGRLPETPWRESLPAFTGLFEELCREAADHGVALAMENCPMDGGEETGDWNLAHHPDHWERLYAALSSTAGDALFLEWEPAHQILQGYEPLDQLSTWMDRIIHVHGKDAGVKDGRAVQTLPGNGATDWSRILGLLAEAGYGGTVDIEGYHDRDWSGNREIDGQTRSLDYLRQCRDGRRTGPAWSS